MFNKFKNGERVIISGVGKMNNRFYYKRKGKVLFRDPYYKDYYVKIDKDTYEWFDEKSIFKMRQRRKKK